MSAETKDAIEASCELVVRDTRAASVLSEARTNVPQVYQDPHSPASLLQLALEQKVSTEQLEKVMDLYERWEAREALKAFTKAMAAFKAECPPIMHKDATVDFTTKTGMRVFYKHASLAGIVGVVSPLLSKHGLSVAWSVTQLDKGLVTVMTTITHVLGHSQSVTFSGPRDESGNKNPIQTISSTTTYLQRYGLMCALGLSTGDVDDDGRGGPDVEKTETPKREDPEVKKRADRAKAVFRKWGVSIYDLESKLGKWQTWGDEQTKKLNAWRELLNACPTQDVVEQTKAKIFALPSREREPGEEG